MSSLLARMKKIKLKMKVLECSPDFSHYKSIGIFPDAQGQLTLQTTVQTGQISNSVETLWLSSIPAKMKKIRSKIEALDCSQHYTSVFKRARADNSGVGGGIWPKFELIQAFMHVLVTCKNEDDRFKNEVARVFTRFLALQVYGDFSRRSRAANSAVLGPIWPNFELVPGVMYVLVTCKYEEDPINKSCRMTT